MAEVIDYDPARARLSGKLALSPEDLQIKHVPLHGDIELPRAWMLASGLGRKLSTEFLEKYCDAKNMEPQGFVDDPEVGQQTQTGRYRHAYLYFARGKSKDKTVDVIVQVLRLGFARTLVEDEWRLRTGAVKPRRASQAPLVRYNPNVDPEYAMTLVTGLKSSRSVSNPKTRKKTWTGTFLRYDALGETNEDGSVTITDYLSAWGNTTPTYEKTGTENTGGYGEESRKLAEAVPLDSAEGIVNSLNGTSTTEWTTSTAYTAGNVVKRVNATYGCTNVYVCLTGHNSGDFSEDFRAGKWQHVTGVHFEDSGEAEAKLIKAERKGHVLIIESGYTPPASGSLLGVRRQGSKTKTWYGVPIDKYDYYWAEAKAYTATGYTSNGVRSHTAADNYSVISATIIERDTSFTDATGDGGSYAEQYNGRSGVYYDYRTCFLGGAIYKWFLITTSWQTYYHTSESSAYTRADGGCDGTHVDKVPGVQLWRCFKVKSIVWSAAAAMPVSIPIP